MIREKLLNTIIISSSILLISGCQGYNVNVAPPNCSLNPSYQECMVHNTRNPKQHEIIDPLSD